MTKLAKIEGIGPIYAEKLQAEGIQTIEALLEAGKTHHVTFIVDGGPKIITVLVDGILCDGGLERQYGWGRFHADLSDANGTAEAKVHDAVEVVRIYDRYLRTSEAVANYRAASL